MPLQGTFDVLNFSEILRLLARQQLTGRLHIRSRSFSANLFLEEGALVGADQSEHLATASAGDVRGRLEEICFEMLDAERGAFEFQAGKPSTLAPASRLKVDMVLARARRRLDEWRELQQVIPSMDVQPRLIEELAPSEIMITKERWRVITACDGRRNLRMIGRILGVSDFDVCRVVRSLVEDGILECEGRSAALATASRELLPAVPTPEPAQVLESVRIAEREGKGQRGHGDEQSDAEETLEPAGDEARADALDRSGPAAVGDPGFAPQAGQPRRARRVVRIRSRLTKTDT